MRGIVQEGGPASMLRRDAPMVVQLGMTLLVTAAVLVYVWVALKAAWLSDDAYITFRTVDNFVHGHGLTWNTHERVQAYTHPLWMFALSGVYLATNVMSGLLDGSPLSGAPQAGYLTEFYATAQLFGVLVSAAAVTMLAIVHARAAFAALLAVVLLALSRAFVDYSTSGLENPLTHLLLVIFVLIYFGQQAGPKRIFLLSLVAALGTLNRMDTLLLYAPALLAALAGGGLWRSWRAWCCAGAGFLPFVLWSAFSLWYYGFLFPNTAYAKLNTGIEAGLLARQGLAYFISHAARDPISVAVLAAGMLCPLLLRDWRALPLSAGAALYLLYVLRVGGDFMMGRFLTAPLFVAALLLARVPLRPAQALPGVLVAVLLGFMAPHPTVNASSEYGEKRHRRPGNVFLDARGISDQRGFYYPFTGLARGHNNQWKPAYAWANMGKNMRAEAGRLPEGSRLVKAYGAVGFKGYYAGPEVIIVDYYGLCDPLLARLPASDPEGWHIGHFRRDIPRGYIDSVRSGENRIAHPGLAEYYDALCEITRGPLLSWSRMKRIWRMNTRGYAHLLADYERGRPGAAPAADREQALLPEGLPRAWRQPEP